VVALWGIALVAGAIAGLSPCVLPVLPVVFLAWTAPGEPAPTARGARRRRALAVVAGLVVSFSVATLAGSALLSALHLPQGLLRDVGLAVVALVGLGLLLPTLGEALERPFRRLGTRAPDSAAPALVLGLALGAVYVPCAGPVLAAVTVLGARHRVSLDTVVVTGFFALGSALPLLAVALAGERAIERSRRLSAWARRGRPVAGAVLVLVALGLALNLFDPLQRALPGYTSALQSRVEGTTFARQQIARLEHRGSTNSLANCATATTVLERCGRAPEFTGITTWLNTPGDAPLSLARLRGRVVLVDFWTYSCINCQRTLAHLEAWDRLYRPLGLTIVGVHSPEFAFEHVVGNVRAADARLGVRYPVAVDDRLATWSAYDNAYWPAEYLIDAHGVVRHVSFGEGEYATTERLIRELLVAEHPRARLPHASEVPDRTPTEPTSLETYLGLERAQYYANPSLRRGTASYVLPLVVPPGQYGLGGSWRTAAESTTAVADAQLRLHFSARAVYLVMGGRGTVRVVVPGAPARVVRVGGLPRLYTLYRSRSTTSAVMTLEVSPGVSAYDVTFG
jgi:cytochrome c biogenesis protein CcdA/thiol-disulfide isomerase/thioredoxin